MSDCGPSPDPWRVCFAQLAPKLLLYARQWVPPADAEDVVQAGFVRFWRKQPEAQPAHYPLLYAAVRTAALDWRRAQERRWRRDDSFYAEQPPETACFETGPEDRERAESVQAALAALPPEQREALVLRLWSELTFAEIASALGLSINTVASRYRYALDALRQHLKAHLYERV